MIAVLILIAAIIGGGAFYLGAVGIAGAIAISMSLIAVLCIAWLNFRSFIYRAIEEPYYRRKLKKLREKDFKRAQKRDKGIAPIDDTEGVAIPKKGLGPNGVRA